MFSHYERRQLWSKIIQIWKDSNLRAVDFYRMRFAALWPKDESLPSVKAFYRQIQCYKMDQRAGLSAFSTNAVVHSTGLNAAAKNSAEILVSTDKVTIAEVSMRALHDAMSDVSGSQSTGSYTQSLTRLLRLRLSDGSVVEFVSEQPEAFALTLFNASRRSA